MPGQSGTRNSSSPISHRSGYRQFALLLCLIGLQGCATLPDVKREMAEPRPKQVVFEGADGPVSALKSAAVLRQLNEGESGTAALQKHLTFEQSVNAGSPLVLGNKLTLLQNGPATYESMFAAIRSARDHINLETFIFDDDEAGRQFSELLLKKQADGVQVNVIYDSVGGITTPAAFFDRLREGGIKVLEYNPINPLAGKQKDWLINNRDHRKQLIVDGRIAFTGGINISDTYESSPSGARSRKKRQEATDSKAGWRDTHIRIEGPVVAEFQRLFLDTWTKQRGAPLAGNFYPVLQAQGDQIVRAIGSASDDPERLIYLTLMSAISHAETSVHLTIAYFAPDPQLLTALTDAAGRGVEVQLVLPSHTDSWAIFHLGRSYYTDLLRGGVKIYERRGSVMHAKTACIDGVWSTIGSTNLDSRSFLHNDEVNAVILGRDFAAQMDAMFAQDIAESDIVRLEAWKRRSLIMRVKERAARVGAYWL